MTPDGPSRCPRCGGELERDRDVERHVREGNDVAIVTVRVDSCLRCGEVLLHPGMVERLAKAREVLRHGPPRPAVGHVYDLRPDEAA